MKFTRAQTGSDAQTSTVRKQVARAGDRTGQLMKETRGAVRIKITF